MIRFARLNTTLDAALAIGATTAAPAFAADTIKVGIA